MTFHTHPLNDLHDRGIWVSCPIGKLSGMILRTLLLDLPQLNLPVNIFSRSFHSHLSGQLGFNTHASNFPRTDNAFYCTTPVSSGVVLRHIFSLILLANYIHGLFANNLLLADLAIHLSTSPIILVGTPCICLTQPAFICLPFDSC